MNAAKPYLVVVAAIASVWGLASIGIWLIESAPWWARIAAAWTLVAIIFTVVWHYLIGTEPR